MTIRPPESVPVTVLKPPGRWPAVNLREAWAHRELLYFLAWRDIKVRYAQTVLGAGWAILQPVMMMVVFTVIFGKLVNVPSDGVPYQVFSLTALVPWTYFSTAVTTASNSLISQPELVTKVYFPRIIIPMSSVLAGVVDLAVGLVIVVGFLLFYGMAPAATVVIVVPILVLTMVVTAVGVGYWLSALNIQYRDVKYVVPFFVQIWMYASPIVYPLSLVPERFQLLYSLNPMVAVIEGFRGTLLGTEGAGSLMIGMSALAGVVILVTGAFYFRHAERVFADVA